MRLGSISEFFAFLLFVCEVGRRFDRLVFFGRADRGGEAAEHMLPPGPELNELPHYGSLRDVRGVLAALPATARALWRGLARVDVVWVFGPHPVALLVIALALLRGKRVVLGVRFDTIGYYRSRMPSRRWLPALAAVWPLELSYRLLSRRLRTTVVGTAIAPRYGNVLPMTVSLMRAADVAAAPAERDWQQTIELLTVGRLEPEKNPLLAVELVAALERERPGRYRLTWVGAGPLAEDVLARARELGVSDRIDLPGFVPFGPELLARYRRAHAFVHVALTEGVPAAIVEALAAGIPVVATDVGGVAGAVDGGRAALLVPPADLLALRSAVLTLEGDPALRDRLALAGLQVARAATIEAEGSRTAAFLAGETNVVPE